MKFPKSIHAEGWDSHFSGDASTVRTNNPAFNLKRGFKAGAKPVSLHTPLPGAEPALGARPASAAYVPPPVAAPAAAPVARGSSLPWVVGAGVGVVLIGGAVMMSRPVPPAEPSVPVVVGQVTPSPEDAQLQASPPSAGTVSPDAAGTTDAAGSAVAAEATPPARTDAVAAQTAPAPRDVTAPTPAPAEVRVAKAPAVSGPPVWTATPAPKAESPAPVVRTLSPQPEVLAQASLPPRPAAPTAPVTPPVTPPAATPLPQPTAPLDSASAVASAAPVAPVPAVTAPAVPPVVAQQAPAPAPGTPDPVDTTITVQVRQALAADATLAAVPIAVSTDHGVVKLEGQAPDAQAKDRATVVAANTTGVKAVDNRLTLPPVALLDRGPAGQGG